MTSGNDPDWKTAAELVMPLEDLALVAAVPTAFIRLAIDCGCPAQNGCLSHLTLVCWLSYHYDRVREAAALHPLPPVQTCDDRQRLQMQLRNMLLTMADYSESRCTDRATKRALREWSLRIAAGAED